MNYMYVTAIISCVILIGVCLLMARQTRPGFKSYFVWAAGFFLLALIANAAALAAGLGYKGARANYSFHPFVIFINVFFIPPGIVLGAMGWYDSTQNPDESSLHI